MTAATLDALDALESEAIHIFREVAGEFDRPVILFSGGKDSTLLVHLAVKAFAPAPVPFPLLHVDTGHNYPEVIEFRDRARGAAGPAAATSRTCRTGSTTAGSSSARTAPATRCRPCRCSTRSPSTGSTRCSAAAAATRSAPGPRSGSSALRDAFGRWDPRSQRPELWNLYNGRHAPGEHVRVFPISNWTELDVWRYIQRENIELPSIYYAHERDVFRRDGMWLAEGPWGGPRGDESWRRKTVRYRTVGDGSCTGAVESDGDRRSTRSSPRSRRRGSPSAARPGPTTGSARPPWKTASGRATSDGRVPLSRRAGGDHAEGRPIAAEPHHVRDLLRFATAGSVDDGKSTLVGRLLYDTKSVLADQIEAVQRASVDKGLATPDLSLLVDGLRAEREQGITIDVAYRYFATPEREFVLADTPGPRAVHPQHGDRRVHRGAGGAAGRRPQRRRRADPPARRRARAAARAAAGAGDQQDRPRRLRRGGAHRDRQGLRRAGRGRWASRTTPS